ncbi:MAG: serine/threonine protein kinase, partial [Candidatus Riflebacteria bacterium]|nr:serine/threonine protein kinase [Candidatus Riflebacteria bacterium]
MASDRLGNYRLLSRLGAGGTGTVFKAQQENLNRVVALKVLHPGFGRQAALVKRFKREILTTAALSHPNLVKVYDAGQDGDRYYFSMEFIDGYPLRDRLRGGKSVPPKEAIRFTHQLADAIRYLHAKGMVHRDIKPENIMVCTDGNVKLMDFGIVKVQDQTVLTQEGSTVGTPRYMSPEMVTGEPQDLRSDIYQMGVILYEMLAGKCPFDGPTISDIANKITDEPAQPPSLSASGLSLGLDRVVMRCLEKNPADRYPDAEAFDLDLTEAESDLDTGGRLTTRPLQPRRGPSVQAHTPPPVAQQPAQVQTQALPAQPSRVPLPGGDGETWVERSYRTLSDSLQEPSVRKGLLLSPVAFLLGLGIVFWL